MIAQMPDKPNDSSLKIPLIVGVIGHIDIADSEEGIRDAMNIFWNHLKKIVPDSRFILLSSLARGADHLAVKYRPREVDCCAVLPFERTEYEKCFSGSELDDFMSDLREACKTIVCDAEAGDYSVASDYIRTHSDVILSLWDGRESLNSSGQAKIGGTYQQIRCVFHLDDILVEHREKKHGVVNIRVRRKGGHSEAERDLLPDGGGLAPEILEKWVPETGVFSVRPFAEWNPAPSECYRGFLEIGDTNSVAPSIDAVVQSIREHNRLFLSATDDCIPQNDAFYGDLISAAGDGSLPEEIRADYARYHYFDTFANEHQGKHRKEFRNIAILSFLVGLLGQAWGDLTFSPDDVIHERILHSVILLYLIGCLCAWLYYRNIKKTRNYSKYVGPRVIAELMRLKTVWTLARIPYDFFDSILKDSANYLFAIPVCNWEIEDRQPSRSARDTEGWEGLNGRLDMAKSAWMDKQVSYYDRRCRDYERKEARFNALKRLFFWGAFFLAAALLLIFILVEDHCGFLNLAYYREFIIGICPFVVSSIGWLLEKNNWGAQAREYRRMADLFRKTIEIMKLEPTGTDEQKLKLIRKKQEFVKTLMTICHEENSTWQEIKGESGGPEPMF